MYVKLALAIQSLILAYIAYASNPMLTAMYLDSLTYFLIANFTLVLASLMLLSTIAVATVFVLKKFKLIPVAMLVSAAAIASLLGWASPNITFILVNLAILLSIVAIAATIIGVSFNYISKKLKK